MKTIDILLDWSTQLEHEPTLALPVLNNPTFTADDRDALLLVQQRVDAAAARVAQQLANLEPPQTMRPRRARQQPTARICVDA
ncbi:MAG: hypothetical protein L7T83_01320 [Ilumatobacteraceae bacterium]|nr:hypothetical protein [Ilumatobacteraceae bacterium]